LPQEARDKVCKYRHKDDQKRAAVSQFLQRACISRLLAVDWQQIQLKRTKGNKPFYAGSKTRDDAPNFNFNVSHEVCGRADMVSSSLLLLQQVVLCMHHAVQVLILL
jgi:phosphopantetheinyl transferase